MNSINPRRNDLYFVEIPYVDANKSKDRPAIILSRNNYNEKEPDVIVCGITTNLGHPWLICIEDKDLEQGKLFDKSGVRVDTISRVHKSALKFKVGKVTDEFHKRLLDRINELIG
ncbi:MAG: type II toxin-antitoxin system PemK/MazF family toxin [Candidatus Micrarchaeota archaeon]